MKKNIREFLKSDLSEADFYHLSKEDLISLKDYLELLREIDNDFEDLIQEPINIIKEKCDWFKDISYMYLVNISPSSIRLLAKDNIDLIAVLNSETEKYEELAKNIPRIYLINPKVRTLIERQKDLDLIQDELHQIVKIGNSIYDTDIISIHSISDNFYISYTPRIGMDIWYSNGLLASYHERYIKQYNKPLLNDKKKDKILTKIQVKNNII